MKLVVVGEAPNHAAEKLLTAWTLSSSVPRTAAVRIKFLRRLAGTGTTGERLAELAGVPFKEWLAATDRFNVLDRWPGRGPKGDAFPRDLALLGAGRLLPIVSGRRVLFLGHRVAGAFRLSDEYLRWREWRVGPYAFEAAVFPHPSRVNRWWNDPENEKRAARFLRAAFTTAREGKDR